jgi:hypothetical protein
MSEDLNSDFTAQAGVRECDKLHPCRLPPNGAMISQVGQLRARSESHAHRGYMLGKNEIEDFGFEEKLWRRVVIPERGQHHQIKTCGGIVDFLAGRSSLGWRAKGTPKRLGEITHSPQELEQLGRVRDETILQCFVGH